MTLQELEKQHFIQYQSAVETVVCDYNDRFFREDIVPLFEKPPLESMDQLKQKFLSTAKVEELVLNSSELEELLATFRNSVVISLESLSKHREKQLVALVARQQNLGKSTTIKLPKREYQKIDKELRNKFKELLTKLLRTEISSKLSQFSSSDTYVQSMNDFLFHRYLEDIMTKYDSKLAHKNNLLTNNLKEQGHRYLFTKKNSHLFQ